jgi:hypothetical protein
MTASELQQWVEGLVAQVEADTSVEEAHARYQAVAANIQGLNEAWMASGATLGSAEALARQESLRAKDAAWNDYEFAKLTRFGVVHGIRQAINSLWDLVDDAQTCKILQAGLSRLEAL